MWLWFAHSLACIHSLDDSVANDSAVRSSEVPTLAGIVSGDIEDGSFITLSEAVISTPLTADGRTFFVQNTEASLGLRVDISYPGGVGPAELGRVVGLSGYLDLSHGAPRLLLSEPDWIERTDSVQTLPLPPIAQVDSIDVASAGRVLAWTNMTTLDCANAIGDIPLRGGLTLSDRFGPHPAELAAETGVDQIVGVLVPEYDHWMIWPVPINGFTGISGGLPCIPGPL